MGRKVESVLPAKGFRQQSHPAKIENFGSKSKMCFPPKAFSNIRSRKLRCAHAAETRSRDPPKASARKCIQTESTIGAGGRKGGSHQRHPPAQEFEFGAKRMPNSRNCASRQRLPRKKPFRQSREVEKAVPSRGIHKP